MDALLEVSLFPGSFVPKRHQGAVAWSLDIGKKLGRGNEGVCSWDGLMIVRVPWELRGHGVHYSQRHATLRTAILSLIQGTYLDRLLEFGSGDTTTSKTNAH